MFTPRGYHAVPQEASQDEEETDDATTRNIEKRKMLSAARNAEDTSSARTSRDSDDSEKERRTKRNVRFESRSLEDKPEPMSNARRLCFVVSLMICTLTIFVFAFTVPCKGPSCNVANMITTVTSNLEKLHRNWSMTYPGFSTGIVFHLSSTRINEAVVSYRSKAVKSRKMHRSEKSSGLISLKEDNGGLVWEYNATNVMKLIECTTDNNHFETCLIQSSRGKLQLINPKHNQIVWSTRILIGSILPSIIFGINDCDGDGGRDILLSYDQFNATCVHPSANKTTCTHPGIVQLISGRTGYPLGGRLNIPQSHLIKRVSVHSTRQAENLIFVLTIGNKGHLKVISIKELYRRILESRGDGSAYLFRNSTVSVSDIVSTDHEPVVKDLNKDFVEDIILVTLAGNKHSLTAVDGGKLKKMWRIAFGSRKMLSQPVIGHFNDDDFSDILVILEDPVLSLLNQSLIQILDGQNGNILWSRKLRLAKNTTPLTATVGYKSDVFLLWIEKESKRKYKKIFLSKAAKDSQEHQEKNTQHVLRETLLSDSSRALKENDSESSIAQNEKHHRSPRSVESNGKKTSSVRDMEDELDSLVDEIYVAHVGNNHRTKLHGKSHLKPKRNENTHKILEDILKVEEKRSKEAKRDGLYAGKQKETLVHSKPSTKEEKVKTNSPGTRINSKRPSVTATLATKRPNLHHVESDITKVSNRERVLHNTFDNRGKEVASGLHKTIVITTTSNSLLHDNVRVATRKPSTKLSENGIQQLMIKNPGTRINDKSETVPVTKTARHPTEDYNAHAPTKKPSANAARVQQDNGIGAVTQNQVHTSPAATHALQNRIQAVTKRPMIKVINWKIGRQDINKNPYKVINELPLAHDKIHDMTETQSTVSNKEMVKKVTIDNSGGGVNSRRQGPTETSLTTRPESHGSVKTIKNRNTRIMMDGESVENDTTHRPEKAMNKNTHIVEGIRSTEHTTKHTKILKTIAEVTSLPFILGKHSSEDSNIIHVKDKIATGRNVNVLATKFTVTAQPTDLSGNKHQKKRLLKVSSDTTHAIQNNSTLSDSNEETIRLDEDVPSWIRNRVVNFNKSTSAASSFQHIHKNVTPKRLLNALPGTVDGDLTPRRGGKLVHSTDKNITRVQHGKKVDESGRKTLFDTISPTLASSKRNTKPNSNTKAMFNHSQTIVNHHERKSSFKTELSSETRDHKGVNTNRLSSAKKSNAPSNLGRPNINTRLKPHHKVLMNAGNKGSNDGHAHLGTQNGSVLLKKNKLAQGKPTKPSRIETSEKQKLPSGRTIQTHSPRLKDTHVHATTKPRASSSKKRHDSECAEGFDLALIAILPNSGRSSFSVISQENSIPNTKRKNRKKDETDSNGMIMEFKFWICNS